MDEKAIHQQLAGAVEGVGDLDESGCDPFIVVEHAALRPAVLHLRDDPALAMEMCHLVTATERTDSIEVAYHLCSYQHHHSIVLKVVCPRPEGGGHDDWHPEVPTIADLHAAADWHEREQWDLLGVVFVDHPDPRRILLPQEWIGHPLRKDYVYPTDFGEVPLELDALPMYERGPDWKPSEDKADRPAGTPLNQPPSHYSKRPDAGGKAPESSEGKLNSTHDGEGH